MRESILFRLDARDRALFSRLALDASASLSTARLWVTVTHIGGASSAIAAVLVPLLLSTGRVRPAAALAAVALLLSHLVVQFIKRRAVRERPAPALAGRAIVGVPDRFSFPSGHACAAMAVAFAYGMSFPAWAVPLTMLATIVGMSRVRLGVHYPGDVLAGQAIAIVTVLGLWSLR
jgi:undecaprenyl-diphosphatase